MQGRRAERGEVGGGDKVILMLAFCNQKIIIFSFLSNGLF